MGVLHRLGKLLREGGMKQGGSNPFLLLLAPPPENPFTGGYLYNKRTSECLGERQLSYRFFPGEEDPAVLKAVEEAGYILFDSIYLIRLEYRNMILSIAEEYPRKAAFLIHYLPSFGPLLSSTERQELWNLERDLLYKAQFIVVTSRFMKRELLQREIPDEKIFVNNPGISRPIQKDPSMLRENDKRTGLLTVANWSLLKNQVFLLSVLENYCYLDWEWVIIGAYMPEDPYYLFFQEKAENLGLGKRVSIRGPLPPEETALEMIKAEVFLFPSLQESYGMAIAEAMAAGLPVIANRTGGIPELFEDGKEGYLCNLGKEEQNREDWINATAALLTSSERRKTMGEQAAKRAEALPSWEEQGKRLYAFAREKENG